MTGFPGETEVEFEDSRAFIESLPFTYLHVFTYSERPGTPAAESPAQVPQDIRKRRTHILRELSARKNREFRMSMLGRTISAVTIQDGRVALSENYLKIALAEPREPNQIIDVLVGSLTQDALSEATPFQVLI